MKALCRYQFDFSMFSELYGCCLQQWGLAIHLRRTTYYLANSLGYLGISMNSSIGCLGMESFIWWQKIPCWGFVSLITWQFPLCPLHINIYFRKSLLYWVSMLFLEWPLILTIFSLSPYTFLCLLSPSPFRPDSPVTFCKHIHPQVSILCPFLN